MTPSDPDLVDTARTLVVEQTAACRAFVLARITDDETAAATARDGEWWAADEPGTVPVVGSTDGHAVAVCGEPGTEPVARNAGHVARHSAARVRRQADAHRAIVAGVDKYLDPHPGRACTNIVAGRRVGPCYLHVAATGRVSVEVLPMLAAIWSTHPDHDPAWASILVYGVTG